jgi:hypothetical protein
VPAVTRRQVLVITVAALLTVTVAGLGVFGLLRGPSHPAARHWPTPTGAASPVSDPPPSPAPAQPMALPATDDPVLYARAVATALFDWDTSSGLSSADYTAPVLTDADPSGEEVPGLVSDIASYEPTTAQWAQLASMQVAQHLTVSSAAVPSLWARALAEAHGQLRPGTTAVTVTGVRHRTGVWYGQPAATSAPVSLTVFETCTPGFSRCHTLRLSALNDPLT